jgi:hypothetical protein
MMMTKARVARGIPTSKMMTAGMSGCFFGGFFSNMIAIGVTDYKHALRYSTCASPLLNHGVSFIEDATTNWTSPMLLAHSCCVDAFVN